MSMNTKFRKAGTAGDLTDAVSAAVMSGEISTHAPRTALTLDKTKVYTVDTDGPTYTSVTVPVAGDYSTVSNLTVVFDEKDDQGTGVTAMGAASTAACVAAVLGVSGATAYLIVGACAGACTIPIVGTAICIACIGAYAAVGGASITAVASCF